MSHEPEPELEPTLADSDDSQEERGRIGYGAHERKSSWVLGAVLILVVLAIGGYQWFGSRDDEPDKDIDSPMVGNEAPDFTLQTFSGENITLSEQRGKVVIVNFWGSWCEPCKREMPAFQAFSENAPDDVVIIGVGSKQDTDANARAFAEGFGITYPIGRDDGGNRITTGVIAQAYQITFYPTTFVINPDGKVSSLVIGEMNEDDLQSYVDKARDEVSRQELPLAIDRRRFA